MQSLRTQSWVTGNRKLLGRICEFLRTSMISVRKQELTQMIISSDSRRVLFEAKTGRKGSDIEIEVHGEPFKHNDEWKMRKNVI